MFTEHDSFNSVKFSAYQVSFFLFGNDEKYLFCQGQKLSMSYQNQDKFPNGEIFFSDFDIKN